MDRFINWLVAQLSRFFGWMFSTRNGWIFIAVVIFITMMKFHPELLAQFVSNLCAWLISLLARIIEANRHSIEMLFCIGLLCLGIVLMFKGIFGKRGGSSKK